MHTLRIITLSVLIWKWEQPHTSPFYCIISCNNLLTSDFLSLVRTFSADKTNRLNCLYFRFDWYSRIPASRLRSICSTSNLFSDLDTREFASTKSRVLIPFYNPSPNVASGNAIFNSSHIGSKLWSRFTVHWIRQSWLRLARPASPNKKHWN